MILSAAIKALGIMPETMEQGAYHMYRFVATNLTWALLVGVGVLYTLERCDCCDHSSLYRYSDCDSTGYDYHWILHWSFSQHVSNRIGYCYWLS